MDAVERKAMRQTGPVRSPRKDPPIGIETRLAAGQLAETRGNLAAAGKQYREALKVDPKHAPRDVPPGGGVRGDEAAPRALDLWKALPRCPGHSAPATQIGFCYE